MPDDVTTPSSLDAASGPHAARPLPYGRIVLVALAGSALGTVTLLAPIGELDDFVGVEVLCALLSMPLWILLARVIRGRSAWVAAVLGALSPLLVSVVIPPLGLAWLYLLSEWWYLTVLAGAGTGLGVHWVVHDGFFAGAKRL